MKRVLLYLKSRPLAFASLIFIAFLYIIMIFAPFFAPYSPTRSFEEDSFHPANVELTSKGLMVREHRVLNSLTWKYARVRGLNHKLDFFVHGEEYSVFGIKCNLHLFGTRPDETTGEIYPVFLFGSDNLGRDLFSRIVYGSRISLTIGFVASFISLVLAIILGGLSGFFGGATDWTIMRFSEFFMLIPGLYLILFLRSLLNSSMDSGQSYMIITLILSLVGWPGSARTLRGMIHAIKREEFVQNAILEGIPSLNIIFRHIIPQITSLLIVSTTLAVPGFIMSETTLSYLGLGIADPAVSWGSLINRDISTLSNLKNFPWLLIPVFLLLFVTLAFNFFGDALRDYYDPYFKGKIKKNKSNKNRVGESPASTALGRLTKNSPQDCFCTDSAVPYPLATTAVVSTGSTTAFFATPSSGSTPQRPDVLLSVENLHVSFGIRRGNKNITVNSVRGVSFQMQRGEILGIVGESGSGKTVTTTAIPGLHGENATVTGNIWYNNSSSESAENASFINLAELSQSELRQYRGKKIGMIFQEPGRSFDPLQNMESVFFEAFRNSDPEITKEEAFAKAAKLMEEVGLPDPEKRLKNFPHQFSGGQLQRIGIALSLAQGCELLIADEPTTALDVTIQAQIVELLRELNKKRNLSIIFISHNINLVADLCQNIIVMYGGIVMDKLTSQEVRNYMDSTETEFTAHSPYTSALLASSPKFGTHYTSQKMISIPGRVTDPSHPEPGCPFAPRCSYAKEECKCNLTSGGVLTCWKMNLNQEEENV